ncbi:hypothetical protein ES754_06080 [Psychrobacter frigidicola]|uniref:Ribbon-helix-helix protein, CopG family n=1 Tax=Psychrobacter frigidicola TaxID=45611 RepID=A0A5C7A7F3_9GAMM|nr:type II toxin-antitoxin system RelB/DinJ family antitoxin [Psychrobacter frigidicola]TXD98474.1 hypothetical protein ES754_06080 [Psychrobacter frigidicola]
MSKPKQASIHIRCDNDLANEFKQVVEQNGYTKSLVMRELMQDYINNSKKPNLPSEQNIMSQVLKKDEPGLQEPLKDMTSNDLLKLAIRMAEKHI